MAKNLMNKLKEKKYYMIGSIVVLIAIILYLLGYVKL